MKRLFLLLALTTLAATYVSAQLSTNGLVAHWNFDGNVMDQSGNGHHGNANNITYTNGALGQANTAALFQRSDTSYVSIPNSNSFNINQYTIAAKVRADSFYLGVCQNSVIIQRGEAHRDGHFGLLLSDTYYDSSCTITGDTSHFFFGASSGDNNRSMSFKHYQAPNPVSTNRWYCVVATYDSLASRLYIDGQLVATVRPRNAVKPISSSNDSVLIGMSRFGNFGAFPYYLNGAIDDIMLYNRPFTSAEVNLFCNGSTDISNNEFSKKVTSDKLECYPNPTNGIVLLKGTVSTDGTYSINVLNVLGQKVYTGSAVSQQGIISKPIDLSGVPSGMYVMHISSDKKEIVMRVVVE